MEIARAGDVWMEWGISRENRLCYFTMQGVEMIGYATTAFTGDWYVGNLKLFDGFKKTDTEPDAVCLLWSHALEEREGSSYQTA